MGSYPTQRHAPDFKIGDRGIKAVELSGARLPGIVLATYSISHHGAGSDLYWQSCSRAAFEMLERYRAPQRASLQTEGSLCESLPPIPTSRLQHGPVATGVCEERPRMAGAWVQGWILDLRNGAHFIESSLFRISLDSIYIMES
jgi:hypothetical protein